MSDVRPPSHFSLRDVAADNKDVCRSVTYGQQRLQFKSSPQYPTNVPCMNVQHSLLGFTLSYILYIEPAAVVALSQSQAINTDMNMR